MTIAERKLIKEIREWHSAFRPIKIVPANVRPAMRQRDQMVEYIEALLEIVKEDNNLPTRPAWYDFTAQELQPPALEHPPLRSLTEASIVEQTLLPTIVAGKLTCPHCSYQGDQPSAHGGTFRYLADVTTWRDVVKLKGRDLVVGGLSKRYDEDEERNDRLECRNCLSEFALIPDLDSVNFV